MYSSHVQNVCLFSHQLGKVGMLHSVTWILSLRAVFVELFLVDSQKIDLSKRSMTLGSTFLEENLQSTRPRLGYLFQLQSGSSRAGPLLSALLESESSHTWSAMGAGGGWQVGRPVTMHPIPDKTSLSTDK